MKIEDLKISKELKFYKRAHKYVYKPTGKELCSVTTWLKDFFSKFEESDAYKNSNDFMRKKWAKSGKVSSKAGTKTHKEIEQFLVDFTQPTDPKALLAMKWLNDKSWDDIVAEVKIFDEKLGLAGTIDAIMVNEDGSLTLVDWKTNKEIKFGGYKGAVGKGSCSDIPDANFFHYALQLSTYSYMLQQKGFIIKECILLHLKETSYDAHHFDPYYLLIQQMLKEKNGYEIITRRDNKNVQQKTTDKTDII